MKALDTVRTTETCKLCGLPKKICRDSKNEARFKAEADRCFALKAIHAQQRRDEAEKMPDPQSLAYTVSLS